MYRTSPRSAGLVAGILAAFLGVAVTVPAQAAGGGPRTVPLPMSGASPAAESIARPFQDRYVLRSLCDIKQHVLPKVTSE